MVSLEVGFKDFPRMPRPVLLCLLPLAHSHTVQLGQMWPDSKISVSGYRDRALAEQAECGVMV